MLVGYETSYYKLMSLKFLEMINLMAVIYLVQYVNDIKLERDEIKYFLEW